MNSGDRLTPEPDPIEPRRSRISAWVKRVITRPLLITGRLLALLMLLGLIGHFVRGQALPLEMLLYFPVLPLGIAAIPVGAAVRGVGFRKEGTFVIQLGVVSILVFTWWMRGTGPAPSGAAPPPEKRVRLLHWNVLWGGINQNGGGWETLVEEIAKRAPDIIVLSEAAPNPLRQSLIDRLGQGWTEVTVEHPLPTESHEFRMVVLARWPVILAPAPSIRNGATCEVVIHHPIRPIRILGVDGKSRPTIPRSAMLQDIAAICDQAATSETESIDVVAGDFNCVGRTRGFDWLRAAAGGYSLASEASDGWRATWPSYLPLYDIDHVWVRKSIAIRSCMLFSKVASDHRGQVVELELP